MRGGAPPDPAKALSSMAMYVSASAGQALAFRTDARRTHVGQLAWLFPQPPTSDADPSAWPCEIVEAPYGSWSSVRKLRLLGCAEDAPHLAEIAEFVDFKLAFARLHLSLIHI